MIDNFNIYLVNQLKKQPRHGQTPPSGDILKGASDAFTAVQGAFNGMVDAYSKGSKQIVQDDLFNVLNGQAQKLVQTLGTLEASNLKIQTSFNLNTRGASQLGVSIEQLAVKQKQNTQTAKEYASQLTNVFAGQTKYLTITSKIGNQLVKQNGILGDNLKVSALAAENYVRYQASIGGKSKDDAALAANLDRVNNNVANVADNVKGYYTGAATDIIEMFANLSAKTSAQYGKDTQALALAGLKAKQLGITLDEVADAAAGSLNIEESITAELSATIVMGEELTTTIKDANGEREVSIAQATREAVLANDINALTNISVQLADKYGERIKEDLFARKEIAALMGVSEESLVKMVTQQQAMSNVSDKLFNTNVADLKVTNAKLEAVAEIESKQTSLEKSQATANIQQSQKRGDYTSQQMKTTKASLKDAEKITGLQSETDAMEKSGLMKIVVPLKGVLSAAGALLDGIMNIGSGTTPAKDLFIPAGGDGTVISGPYGSFSMAPGDDILAAPNIRQAAGGGGSDTSAIIAALQGMSFHVSNVFDGDKIQSSLSIRQGQTLNNINQGY